LNFDSFNTGGAQPSLNRNNIYPIQIGIPEVEEQRSIAATISDVDELISSLDKLIVKKRAVKTAAMQELLTGRKRLPGFSGEWKEKRLGELGQCIRGVSYNGNSDLLPFDTDDTVRLFRANNVQDSSIVIDDLQFVRSEKVSDEQVMLEGDVLICMANGNKELVGKAGPFNIADSYRYTFGAFMGCYRTTKSEADPRYVSYLFQTGECRDYITKLTAGSSINNLKPSDVESLSFLMPNISEQEAIADVLDDITAEILHMENRHEKTKTIKQGMMQELLTGKTRLV
jgi:type I restriction enzyme S subunit